VSKDDENELDREIQNMAEQLTDEKVDALARRLGLRDEEKPHRTEQQDAVCSFCQSPASEVGPLVTNGAGAHICRRCLVSFQSQ